MIRSYKEFENQTFVPKHIDAREIARKQRTYEAVAKLFTDEKCPANYANLINDYLIDQFKERYDVNVKVYDNNFLIFFVMSEDEPHEFKLESEPFLRFYGEHELEIDFQLETSSYDVEKTYSESCGSIKSPEDIWNFFDKRVLQVYLLPRINKIIESVDTIIKFDPYEELRKYWKKMKYGLRNLDSQLIYRTERGRPQMNHNALKSMFIVACVEDNSILKDNNWNYVFDNISGYNCFGEKGMNLVKLIVDKYKPTTEQIKKTLKSLIEGFRIDGSNLLIKRKGKEIPAANYLINLLSDSDLKKFIDSLIYFRYQSDLWCCNWLIYNNYITCKTNVARTYHVNSETALRFMVSREGEYSGWQLLKDPDCEFTERFFKKIKEHPNNGGLNSSDTQFSRVVYQLYHIPKFKKYLEEHPEENSYYEDYHNKFFHVHNED